MRILNGVHTTGQKATSLNNLVKIIFSKTGESTVTYYNKGNADPTLNRILEIDHTEEPFNQKATIVMDNSDKSLLADFQDYTAVIYYGLRVSGVDYYSSCAPLKIKDTYFTSVVGRLMWNGYGLGIPNLLAQDVTSRKYPGDLEVLPPAFTNQWIIGQILGCHDDSAGLRFLTGPGSVFKHCDNIDYNLAGKVKTAATSGGTLALKSLKMASIPSGSTFTIMDKVINSLGNEWIYPATATPYTLTVPATVTNGEATVSFTPDLTVYAGAQVDAIVNIILNPALDSLISTLTPKDSFYILPGETRLAVLKRLLFPTTVKAKFHAYIGTYNMSLAVPTSSGVVYDYSYTLTDTPPIHTFFQKYRKNKSVVPNHIDVQSRDDDDDWAVDGTVKTLTAIGSTLLPIENISEAGTIKKDRMMFVHRGAAVYSYKITEHSIISGSEATIIINPGLIVAAQVGDSVEFWVGQYGYAEITPAPETADLKTAFYRMPLASNAQANAVADAMLAYYQMFNPKGSIVAPQNAAQEVYDYITIDDNRENSSNTYGNVGRIRRFYKGYSNITVTLGNDNMMEFRNIRDASTAAMEEMAQNIDVLTETMKAQGKAWDILNAELEKATKQSETPKVDTEYSTPITTPEPEKPIVWNPQPSPLDEE